MTLASADFELLLQANRILSSKLDVEEVLQTVMEFATKVVKAEASSLLLLDEKTNELYFDVALGSVKESVKQIRLKVGEGIAGWVAKEKKPLIVNDVKKDKRFTVKVDKSTRFITRSILAVPLMAKGKLVGVVEAINKEKKQKFSSEDKEVFEAFSSQAAIAIENARLFSAVMHEKDKLAAVFSSMTDGVLLLDDEDRVILSNEAGGRFLGLSTDDVIQRKFDSHLFSDFTSTPSIDNLQSRIKTVSRYELKRKMGKDFYLSMLIYNLKAHHATSKSGRLAILYDVTEEKRGDILKQNFLSLISHKLKTPLTVIVGYGPALLAKTEGMSDFQKKALTSVYQQGESLSNLVDKLLRFTIVESESLDRKVEPNTLSPLIKEAIDAVDVDNEKSAVDVNVDPSIESVKNVLVDGPLTVEVFKNLIENAVKFNDKEKKSVKIYCSKNGKNITIHIQDNGVGIPPEELDRVFQKFYQVEESFTGQIPGAGLGLALCKKVVEGMGGHIKITSDLKKGTDVSVSLPIQ